MSASLVSARDEDDLLDTLDQVADSEGASWSVYRGPVWVDFDVPAKYRIEEKAADEPLRPDEIVVEDVQKMERGAFDLSTPGCDHSSEMHERITKLAFPRLHSVLYTREEEPTEAEVKEAVHDELHRLVNANWRRSARGRRTDMIGQLAEQMRAPVRQIENILRRSGQLEEPPPPQPQAKVRAIRGAKKKPKRRPSR